MKTPLQQHAIKMVSRGTRGVSYLELVLGTS